MLMQLVKPDFTRHGQMLLDTPAYTAQPSNIDIRDRAYRLFEASGRMPGRTLSNWLEAQKQLRHESLQALWIAQERQRRRTMFPHIS